MNFYIILFSIELRPFNRSAVDGSHEKVCPCPYSMSKVGMNALTRIHQRNFDLENMNKTVSAATPGYVATDMTKYKGVLTAEQGFSFTFEVLNFELLEDYRRNV